MTAPLKGRLALERLVFDELEAAVDPKAAKSFRMIEQRAWRDYGQRFFSGLASRRLLLVGADQKRRQHARQGVDNIVQRLILVEVRGPWSARTRSRLFSG